MHLRLVVYNVNSASPSQREFLYTVLSQLDADIVALTEADHGEVVSELAARLNLHCAREKGSGDRYVATLSRFPILENHIHRTPPLTQAALETKLQLPGRRISLYNVHLLPYLLLPFEVRRWQAVGKLLRLIRARPPGAHLIVGDLNAIARGDRVLQRNNPARMRRVMALQLRIIFRLAIPRLERAGYTDCYRRMNPDTDGFTFMPGNPTTRYDYIMADSTFARALRTCRVVDDVEGALRASDHLPLAAEFELDAEPGATRSPPKNW